MSNPQELPARLTAFVDVKSRNWKRVAILIIEEQDSTPDDAFHALELVKKASYHPDQIGPEEMEELERLYRKVKKAYPWLGLE